MRFADQIGALFRKGEYQKVLELFDEEPGAFPEEALAWLSGSFSMLGRSVEAEGVIDRIECVSGAPGLLEARFWLAVGVLRAGKFDRAKILFLENQKKSSGTRDPRARFWGSQGMAFFYSYIGRYSETRPHAELALQAATRLADNYGRVLALDLLGQATVYLGEIAAGLAVLDRALALAKKEKWPMLYSTLFLSRSILSVQFGRDSPALLTKLRRSGNYSDSYSSAYLLLELARQSLLCGKMEACQAQLNEAAQLVFASRNRRQLILLSLRRAHLDLVCGRSKEAFLHLGEAEALLLPEVDRTFLPIVHDLKFRLAEADGNQEAAEKNKRELLELSRSSPTGMHLRILQRRGWLKHTGSSDDLVADEIDQVRSGGEGAVARVLASGRLLMLQELLGVPPQTKIIFLDLEPGRVTIFTPDEIRHGAATLSSNQRKALLAIAGSLPRHAFVKGIWGYEYHPLRHDGLVYTAVNKLRSVLGPAGSWIESHPDYYALANGVELRHAGEGQVEPGPRLAAPASVREFSADLNHRQRKILSYLEAHEEIGLQDCAKLFKISKITACRDLSWLYRQNYLLRTGKARATRYHRNLVERS